MYPADFLCSRILLDPQILMAANKQNLSREFLLFCQQHISYVLANAFFINLVFVFYFKTLPTVIGD